MSNITRKFQEVFEYIWLGAKRIFSGNTDRYPETGVQPFEGDPASENNRE